MSRKDQTDEQHDELPRVIESEQQRGRRPIDFEERERQPARKLTMLQAIRKRRWEDVQAALLVLYDKDSDEYEKSRSRLSTL